MVGDRDTLAALIAEHFPEYISGSCLCGAEAPDLGQLVCPCCRCDGHCWRGHLVPDREGGAVMAEDRTEFIEAARAQAFTVSDPESQDHGRTLVHCRGGFTGADWDLDSVIETIEAAETVVWDSESFAGIAFGHQLAVLTADGMVWRFDVRRPTEKAGTE